MSQNIAKELRIAIANDFSMYVNFRSHPDGEKKGRSHFDPLHTATVCNPCIKICKH